ncbi:unnamed protein product [Urochloa humidicola]
MPAVALKPRPPVPRTAVAAILPRVRPLLHAVVPRARRAAAPGRPPLSAGYALPVDADEEEEGGDPRLTAARRALARRSFRRWWDLANLHLDTALDVVAAKAQHRPPAARHLPPSIHAEEKEGPTSYPAPPPRGREVVPPASSAGPPRGPPPRRPRGAPTPQRVRGSEQGRGSAPR